MRQRIDAVNVLTLYLLVLIGLPSRLTISPLAGVGAPALVVGLACFGWWTYYQVQRSESTLAGPQPVRATFMIVIGCFLMSYVVAMTRAIDSSESSTADIGMISLVSWGGVLLVANDGIRSRSCLDVCIRRLVFAGGALAAMGVIQFVTGEAWVDKITIPGLSVNQSLSGLFQRSGFNRPSGTAIHPIEFGAVITMVLPISINLALTDHDRSRIRRWFPVVAIALAVVMSISRSAIISAVVGLIVVAFAWTPSIRRGVALSISVFAGLVFLGIPGLLGSLTALFIGIGGDPSAQSRTASYAIATEFIERAPIFGRGFFTFLPKYRILDNQYLGLLIEVGAVGLMAVLGLLFMAVVCARGIRRLAVDHQTRQLGQGLFGAICAGAIGLAFYDGFGFPMATGVLFLILGLAGAGYSLIRQQSLGTAGPQRRDGLESSLQ